MTVTTQQLFTQQGKRKNPTVLCFPPGDSKPSTRCRQQWQHPTSQPKRRWEQVQLVLGQKSSNKDLPAWCFYRKFRTFPWEKPTCFIASKYLRIVTQNNFWSYRTICLLRYPGFKTKYYNLITGSMASRNGNIKLSDNSQRGRCLESPHQRRCYSSQPVPRGRQLCDRILPSWITVLWNRSCRSVRFTFSQEIWLRFSSTYIPFVLAPHWESWLRAQKT